METNQYKKRNFINIKLTPYLSVILSLFIICGAQTYQASRQIGLDSTNSESLFDFWLGTWDLTREDADGSAVIGSNYIRLILDGKVIEENFESCSGSYE